MAAIDMTPFISKVSMGGVVLAVVSIAAGLAVLFVVAKGVCICLKMMTGFDTCDVVSVARVAGAISNRKPRDKVAPPKGSTKGFC